MFTKAILAAALVVAPLAANAATSLFSDDFAEVTTSVTNFTGLTNWTVTEGTVDVYVNGGFGLPCPSLGCLDLDGSTTNAGRIETTGALSFLAGNTYTLSFNIAGNQRSVANDTVSVGIDNGVLGAFDVTLERLDDFRIVSAMFSVAADTTGKIFFDHAGGDNFGLLLDRVDVDFDSTAAPIPLPAAAPLLLAAIGGLVAAARRRA